MELILADGSIYPRKGKFYAADRQVDVQTDRFGWLVYFQIPAMFFALANSAVSGSSANMRKGALLIPQKSVVELQGSYQVAVVGTITKSL